MNNAEDRKNMPKNWKELLDNSSKIWEIIVKNFFEYRTKKIDENAEK